MLEEPANQINTKYKDQNELKKLNDIKFNDLTLSIAVDSLKSAQGSDSDIILMDRGILDNYIWYDMYYQEGKLAAKEYDKYCEDIYI